MGVTELNAQGLPDGQFCCQLIVLGTDCLDFLLSGMQALLQCSLVILMLLQHRYRDFNLEMLDVTELRQERKVTLLAASLSVRKAVTASSALRRLDIYCMTEHTYFDLL